MTGRDLRIGIALGSGAARGWAHIGVLNALGRLGIHPEIVCGTSIGSFVGAAFAAGALSLLHHETLKTSRFRVTKLFDFQFSHGGIIGGRRFFDFTTEILGEARIEDLPKRFAAVCTDLNTGNEVWIEDGPATEAVRASCTLPGLVPAALQDGRWLLDGALVNPVPVSVCRALGAHLVIAVNLNGDTFEPFNAEVAREREDADESVFGKWVATLPGADFVRQMVSHRLDEPSILTVMTQSLNIVQDRISRSRLAGDPPDVIICPRLAGIGLLQFDRAEECIRRGEAAVEEAKPALELLLKRLGGSPPPQGPRRSRRS
jgi:NTE family protein